MTIDKSHAQALIKANIRKLLDDRNAQEKIAANNKASYWLKSHIQIYDTCFGHKNLLQHSEERNPRTKKLLQVTRYYISYLEDGSAEIARLLLNPRKCKHDINVLPIHISQHALIRMMADQIDMTKSINLMGISVQILYDEYIWPVDKSICLYVTEGMYALVKAKEEDAGAEAIVVKTFIRADKLDAGSDHEAIHSELKEGEFRLYPTLEAKV